MIIEGSSDEVGQVLGLLVEARARSREDESKNITWTEVPVFRSFLQGVADRGIRVGAMVYFFVFLSFSSAE